MLTDQVLHVARYNAERNFEPAELERRVSLHELKWGDSDGLAALGDEGFDLILGSDIIYHAEHHNVLAETMAALAKPGTVVLLCTPDGSPTQGASRPRWYLLHGSALTRMVRGSGYGSREPNDHPFYNTMCAAPAPLPYAPPPASPVSIGAREPAHYGRRSLGFECEDATRDAGIPRTMSRNWVSDFRGPISLARMTMRSSAADVARLLRARRALRTRRLRRTSRPLSRSRL